MRIIPTPAPVLDVPVETPAPTPAPRPRPNIHALKSFIETVEQIQTEVSAMESAQSDLDRINIPDVESLRLPDDAQKDIADLHSEISAVSDAIDNLSNAAGFVEQDLEEHAEKICQHCGAWKDGPTA